MSTKMTLRIKSSSSEETENLGSLLGHQLKGGEVIELISDLGGGKTTLTRGIARGLGSADHVSSPTFKVCNVYKANKIDIYHYDFYRLNEPGLAEHELADALDDPRAVIIVEWSGIVDHVLPDERCTIEILQTGDDTREIAITTPRKLEYILEDVDTDN